jgi:transposase
MFFLVRQHWGGCRYRHFAAHFKSVLVAMEPWTGAQRAFAVNAFYKNGDSFVIAQREFGREFGIHHNRAVPSAHAIKTWVRNFEATGSRLKKKGGS